MTRKCQLFMPLNTAFLCLIWPTNVNQLATAVLYAVIGGKFQLFDFNLHDILDLLCCIYDLPLYSIINSMKIAVLSLVEHRASLLIFHYLFALQLAIAVGWNDFLSCNLQLTCLDDTKICIGIQLHSVGLYDLWMKWKRTNQVQQMKNNLFI